LTRFKLQRSSKPGLSPGLLAEGVVRELFDFMRLEVWFGQRRIPYNCDDVGRLPFAQSGHAIASN
jgi:hypothetical protein